MGERKRGFVYERPDSSKVWIAFYDASNEQVRQATPFRKEARDGRKQAEALLREIERQIAAGNEVSPEGGPITFQRYADRWIADRPDTEVASVGTERNALKRHVYPVIGNMRIDEVRPRHVRDLVRELRRKKAPDGKPLAPHTVSNIYGYVRGVFKSAVIDELITASPCVLVAGDLPKKRDKDPEWRDRARFSRAEVERILTSPEIAEPRRALYAVLFLADLRRGEASALRWRHIEKMEPTAEHADPLDKLRIVASYSNTLKREKGTKTEHPRTIPIHPALAQILASWRMRGWFAFMGRKPEPGDLIFPSPGRVNRGGRAREAGDFLAGSTMRNGWRADLDALKIRHRRIQDTRRTCSSMLLDAGVDRHLVGWIKDGRPADVLGDYTTLEWRTLCDAMRKLKIDLKPSPVADVIPLRANATGTDGDGAKSVTVLVTLDRPTTDKRREPQGETPARKVESPRPVTGGFHLRRV